MDRIDVRAGPVVMGLVTLEIGDHLVDEPLDGALQLANALRGEEPVDTSWQPQVLLAIHAGEVVVLQVDKRTPHPKRLCR
jgi:hypothetical protein